MLVGSFFLELSETKETKGVSMLSKQDQSSDMKKRILDYAHSLFVTSGFSRVPVEEITSGLGMSKKTFYRYFEGKEDLVRQIVERLVGESSLRIQTIVETDQPFVAKLEKLTTFLSHQFRKISSPFLRDLQIHSPDTWQYIQEFRRKKILTVWAGLIEQGKREGQIRPETNSRLLLLSLLGVIESVVNPSTLANESFSIDEALEGIMQMLFRGVLTDEAVYRLDSLHLTQQP